MKMKKLAALLLAGCLVVGNGGIVTAAGEDDNQENQQTTTVTTSEEETDEAGLTVEDGEKTEEITDSKNGEESSAQEGENPGEETKALQKSSKSKATGNAFDTVYISEDGDDAGEETGKSQVAKSQKAVTVTHADGSSEEYDTLYEAVVASGDGTVISLNEDIEMGFFELDGRRTVPTMDVKAGQNITLDGNGHTVTAKNEAFSMIEVETDGTITVKNIILDGSAAGNRIYSNIINVEGGTAYIEDGAVLKNNATNAVGIGTNVPGGKCIMNGGEITGGVVNTGGTDTGAAVTVLTDSTFIMNGGTISGNQSSTGASGIMVNRGGYAQLNGGTISGNTTTKASMGSAVHIKGGTVDLTGTTITGNSSNGYGAIYVTNHSSFDRKWDSIINISGGTVSGNKNGFGIYLWSKGNIEGTAAYVKFSGSPDMEDYIWALANGYSNLDYKPIEVTGAFTPVNPIEVDSAYDYIIGQEMMDYAQGLEADSSQFIASDERYGYQEDKDNNYLYTEARRPVVFMDGEQEIEGIGYWEFVEDYIDEPSADSVTKEGYVVDGWYKDADLTEEWNFETDKLPRAEPGTEFQLYVKWKEAPAEEPEEPDDTKNPEEPSTGDNQPSTDTPSAGGDKNADTVSAIKTGDENSIGLWCVSLAAAFMTATSLVLYRRRNGRD